ncbi:hypothetical protein HYC85_026486 [Camellia sinensis]|uniref:FBD domain-containing protein n=1 Tax=Camellia sinensis TaxID=4442 RepID=A0A7J7G489_CAMSI|nr:hypothetical protein HYC85_026486 [Camellia sinensis]
MKISYLVLNAGNLLIGPTLPFKTHRHLVKASFDGPCARYIVKNFIQFWDIRYSTKETKIRRSKHLHKSRKVLELNGFVGCKADLQIASYILGSTVSVQEIIIDPSHPNKWAPEDPDKQQLARTRARQHLETRLPFGIQLVLR